MKKNLKKLMVLVLMVALLPISAVLSGCGATPKNEALGVFFESAIIDETTGYPVFEVDENIETKLEYKVNPSSWSGYAVTYAVKDCTVENRARFDLYDQGVIKVKNSDFVDIKIEIYVNGYSDICIVKLKHYPKTAYIVENEITINALSSYIINPYGVFEYRNQDESIREETESLLEHDFKFELETSDETVVQVPNKNRLKICSVTPKSGTANVTVKMLNSIGETLYTFTIKVNVIENVSQSVALVSGYDKVVNSGDSIEINASSLEKVGETYLLDYKLYIFSSKDLIIKNNRDFVATTNSRYAKYDEDEKLIKIKKGLSSDFTFDMYIWTETATDDGASYSLDFSVTIHFD